MEQIQDEKTYADMRYSRLSAWKAWKNTGKQEWRDLYEHYTKQLAEVGEV
jgi:hypothetical protein